MLVDEVEFVFSCFGPRRQLLVIDSECSVSDREHRCSGDCFPEVFYLAHSEARLSGRRTSLFLKRNRDNNTIVQEEALVVRRSFFMTTL